MRSLIEQRTKKWNYKQYKSFPRSIKRLMKRSERMGGRGGEGGSVEVSERTLSKNKKRAGVPVLFIGSKSGTVLVYHKVL